MRSDIPNPAALLARPRWPASKPTNDTYARLLGRTTRFLGPFDGGPPELQSHAEFAA